MTHPLVQKIRSIAADQPDKVVTCNYTTTDEDGTVPECIVGVALHALGVPLDLLLKIDNEDLPGLPGTGTAFRHIVHLVEEFVGTVDTDDRDWISAVQNFQDEEAPWAQVVARFDAAT